MSFGLVAICPSCNYSFGDGVPCRCEFLTDWNAIHRREKLMSKVHDDIAHRFAHHPPTAPNIAEAHQQVRRECAVLGHTLAGLLPESREKSLAFTKLEEAMFWANAAVARAQRLYEPPQS